MQHSPIFLALALSISTADTAAGFTTDELRNRTIERRAVEAVNWGIPVVNFDRMLQAFKEKGGDFNQIVYWGGLFDWRNQTLTPNPDTIYFKPFLGHEDGRTDCDRNPSCGRRWIDHGNADGRVAGGTGGRRPGGRGPG